MDLRHKDEIYDPRLANHVDKDKVNRMMMIMIMMMMMLTTNMVVTMMMMKMIIGKITMISFF